MRNCLPWYWLSTLVTFGLDRVTKWYALKQFVEPVIINKFLTFELIYNRGISWGMLHSPDAMLFSLVTTFIVLIIGCLAWYTYTRWTQNQCIIGELLTLTGAVSNVVDRIAYGGVVDFIRIGYGNLIFPYFNIADVCIVGGVALMVYTAWTEE